MKWRSTATRIAVDVGGTFVDALALDPAGGLRWAKVPNSGGDPRAAIAAAIARVTPHGARDATLLHSTTLATNALLEGKLPAIGLIVTRGFREILGVGGGADTDSQPGEPRRNGKPIVPLELVQEVDERIAADGSVSRGLDEESIRRAALGFRRQRNHRHRRLSSAQLRQPEPRTARQTNPQRGNCRGAGPALVRD